MRLSCPSEVPETMLTRPEASEASARGCVPLKRAHKRNERAILRNVGSHHRYQPYAGGPPHLYSLYLQPKLLKLGSPIDHLSASAGISNAAPNAASGACSFACTFFRQRSMSV